MPVSYTFTLVTNCTYSEHQNFSVTGKSHPAFKPYPDFLLFMLSELLVQSFFCFCFPLKVSFKRDKQVLAFFCLFDISLFEYVVLSDRKVSFWRDKLWKRFFSTFSIAKSDSFVSILAIFAPLLLGSFRAYVNNSFHFKGNFSSLPLLRKIWKYNFSKSWKTQKQKKSS